MMKHMQPLALAAITAACTAPGTKAVTSQPEEWGRASLIGQDVAEMDPGLLAEAWVHEDLLAIDVVVWERQLQANMDWFSELEVHMESLGYGNGA